MTLIEEIAHGENVGLEFKEFRPKESLKFTKTVVAFANGRGGRLLFGVENETGKIVGIPREKVASEMDAIVDTITNTCSPRISVDVKPAVVNGKSLIAVDVRSGENTPYYVTALGMRKGTFVRVGATTRQAEEYTLKGLILTGDNLSFDKQEVRDVKLTAEDIAETCAKMTEVARRNCKTESERRAIREMTKTHLVSMGLLKRDGTETVPTYGYCLVAGLPMPDILTPKIKCGAFRGETKGDFIDQRTVDGGIVSQIDDAYQFVLRNIRVGTELVGTGRRNVYELPIDAVREAICNAVFHRDYLVPSSIYVAVYDDRVEIISPGGLVREMTAEDACNGFSKLRNHALGAALEYMGEVEGWGGGVSRYFVTCSRMGLQTPIFAEEAGCMKVTFFRSKKLKVNGKEESKEKSKEESKGKSKGKSKEKSKGKSKEKSKEKILAALSIHPEWTAENLVQAIGLSRSGVEKNLRLLKRAGQLRRNGGAKGGVWEILGT